MVLSALAGADLQDFDLGRYQVLARSALAVSVAEMVGDRLPDNPKRRPAPGLPLVARNPDCPIFSAWHAQLLSLDRRSCAHLAGATVAFVDEIGTLLHGSAAGRSQPRASTFM
jgi:hypothetical protein